MFLGSAVKKLFLGVVATMLVSVCVSAAPAAAPAPTLAPDFTLKSESGENIRLSEQRGKVVMLNFWASWCGPCRQEMPLLDAIYKKHAKMGFVLLGINVEEDNTDAKKMLKTLGVSFPILFDTGNKLSVLYNLEAMPTSIVIDKKGKIRYIDRGYSAGDENKYRDQIVELLRE